MSLCLKIECTHKNKTVSVKSPAVSAVKGSTISPEIGVR